MKVKTLIALLQNHDPNAEVYLATQPSYPFEHSIGGVACRADLPREPREEGDEPESDGGAPSDVFIAEGRQLRYGSKDIWDVASRG
jgi:hypothetical protein